MLDRVGVFVVEEVVIWLMSCGHKLAVEAGERLHLSGLHRDFMGHKRIVLIL